MARTTPVNSGYTIINGTTRGTNVSEVDTWLEYKVTAQSIENNTSTIRVILYSQARRTASTQQMGTARQYGYVQIDGGTKYYLSTTFTFENHTICKFADHTFTVTHNENGTKSVTLHGDFDISQYVGKYLTGGSAQGTVTLPTIPRYAVLTTSLQSRTETTAVISWTTDKAVDQIWYSIDNGSSWTNLGAISATSGSYTITGLTANTAYQVKTRVKSTDSQLTTDSTALSVTTYAYPYATGMPNFVIGAGVTITLSNPLGRSVTVKVLSSGGTECASTTTTGTSVTINTTAFMNALYATIPSATSGTYKVSVIYGSVTQTANGGTYSANATACTPAITALTYADVYATTMAITQDATKIIQNQSRVRYTATGVSAKNSATIASVVVAVNGATISLSASGTSYVGGGTASDTINSGTNVTATVTVTDSRGYTVTKSVTIEMYSWSLPTAIITLERHNNYYSETDILADANYSSLGGNNTCTIRFRTKQTSASSYGSWTTIQDNVTYTFTADNTASWDVQVQVSDRIGSTTYNLSLNKGMPLIYFDRLRNAVGINCFPQSDESLWLNGYDMTYQEGTVTLESGWSVYSTGTPKVRRQGRTVYLNGVIKPDSTVTLDTTGVDIGTINEASMRPSETVYALCQGSGTSLFFLRVYTNGKIHIERLRDVANANGAYTQGTSSMWFPFSVTWII